MRRSSHLYSLAALGAGSLCGASAALCQRPAFSTQPLASTIQQPHLPTTVLVHGLDSSKETWSGVLSDLAARGYPTLALDLRGHGESPLGPPDDFSAEALASDVWAAVAAHGVQGPVVLVGHSMGGRIAMRVAAMHAEQPQSPTLAAVVIEDMDLRPRFGADPPDAKLAPAQRDALKGFEQTDGRSFGSWESARTALLPWFNGQAERVDSWRGKRVRETVGDGRWWSDINPAAQRLARDRVLATSDGSDAWDTLSSSASLRFPVHVWVADQPGTVCAWDGAGGIDDMAKRLPAARVRMFDGSAHSIHNTAREPFVQALEEVIVAAAHAMR
tara:strand:- start:6169 stop:7158 length:990 start_codon:yes stop_codon:yes gene_type:complete